MAGSRVLGRILLYASWLEILVGLVSLGLASVIFGLYTRKRNAPVGLALTTKAIAALAAGTLVLLLYRKVPSRWR